MQLFSLTQPLVHKKKLKGNLISDIFRLLLKPFSGYNSKGLFDINLQRL